MDLGKLLKHASVGDHDSLDTLARALNRMGYPRGRGPRKKKRTRSSYVREIQEREMVPVRTSERARTHFIPRLGIPELHALLWANREDETRPAYHLFKALFQWAPPFPSRTLCKDIRWSWRNVVPWSEVKVTRVCKKCMKAYQKGGESNQQDWYWTGASYNILFREMLAHGTSVEMEDHSGPEFDVWVGGFEPGENNLPMWLLAGRYIVDHLESLAPGATCDPVVSTLEYMETFTRQMLTSAELPLEEL